MYNLIEYSKNYRKIAGSLWNYYSDKLSDNANDNNSPSKKVIKSESFKYKTSITGSSIDYNADGKITETQGHQGDNPAYDAYKFGTKKVETAVLLTNLNNFFRTLGMGLINCEINLILAWSENCVITSMEKRVVTPAQGDNPAVLDDSPTRATFKITDTKL